MKLEFELFYRIFVLFICSFLIIQTSQAYSSEAVRLYNQGVEDVKKENYKQAVKSFEDAIFEDSSIKNAYFNLGSVYKHLGMIDKAKEILGKLVRLAPEDDEAVFVLSKLYFEDQDYQNALFYLNTIKKNSPKAEDVKQLNQSIQDKILEQKVSEKKASRDWKIHTLKDFNGPAGIACDSFNNIYVANYKDNTIEKISPHTGERSLYKNDYINGPVGVAVDSTDNIYVANYISSNIVKISPAGEINILLDEIHRPYYLFIKDDILYITEQDKNTLLMINLWEF